MADFNYRESTDRGLIESFAYAEHAQHAANNGWWLTSRHRSESTGMWHSTDLTPGQPVILPGGSLAFATGYEQNVYHGASGYEVRMGSPYGPLAYVPRVLPCTEANAERRHAAVLADALATALHRAHTGTQDEGRKNAYRRMEGKAAFIKLDLENTDH